MFWKKERKTWLPDKRWNRDIRQILELFLPITPKEHLSSSSLSSLLCFPLPRSLNIVQVNAYFHESRRRTSETEERTQKETLRNKEHENRQQEGHQHDLEPKSCRKECIPGGASFLLSIFASQMNKIECQVNSCLFLSLFFSFRWNIMNLQFVGKSDHSLSLHFVSCCSQS
jgi:hypothetical protein